MAIMEEEEKGNKEPTTGLRKLACSVQALELADKTTA
jgi:hypothetical protein